jgi:hypothetical protein
MKRRTFCKVLLVVVAAAGLLAFSGVLLAQGRSEDAFDRVREVQERHTEVLMARPGVVGTAVGLNGDGGHVVLVLLENPGVGGIPQGLEGVPVRVMVTGKVFALAKPPWAGGGGGVDPTSRFERPVPIGVSTGHPDITAGTIGCRVTDGSDVYALSNNHVYAATNSATIGDNVLQPGDYDGGKDPADAIGTLFDFEPINFAGGDNTIDAAIALSSVSELDNQTPSDGYGTPNSLPVAASLNLPVQKYGRTTGLTKGTIAALNATVNVSYGAPGVARFVDQIVITPGRFSDGGDSGSAIVTDDDNANPVGLLFAGSSTHTIACRIDLVLGAFDVTIDGKVDGASPPPPPTGGTVSVDSITYGTEGGRNGDKHLLITVALVAEAGPVSGASVSIDLFRNGLLDSRGTGTTGANGKITFTRKNAPSGPYTTTVTDVIAAGLTWDEEQPSDPGFTK